MDDKTTIHTQYTDRIRVQHINEEPSVAHQSFADECNINLIIDRYKNTGVIDHVRASNGEYMDVSEAGDFQTMQNNMKAVATAWELLPERVKAEFSGPEDWVQAYEDEERIREIAKRVYGELELDDQQAPGAAGSGLPEPAAEGAGQGSEGPASDPQAQ